MPLPAPSPTRLCNPPPLLTPRFAASDLYESLNWRNPRSTVPLAGGIVIIGAPLVVLMFWALILVRRSYRGQALMEDSASPDGTHADQHGVHRQGSDGVLAEGGCCSALKHELSCARADAHDALWVEHFGNSKQATLRQHPGIFMGLRTLLFLVILGTTAWSLGREASKGHLAEWFIWLTHWTLLIELFYLGSALYLTALAMPRLKNMARRLSQAGGGEDAL